MAGGAVVKPPPTAVFDIDGVLADSWGRRHHLRTRDPDWDGFFQDCLTDTPLPLITVANMLSENFYQILLVSSRPEANREKTLAWLHAHGVLYDRLYMRPDILTHGWDDWKLSALLDIANDNEVKLIFEDCPAVIVGLRARGLPVVPILSGYYGWQVRG